MLEVWLDGITTALEPSNLLILLAGTIFGIILGVIPGIGPIQGVAILLPLTFTMDPVPALILLGAVYSAGLYGGLVTSILIGTPGDPVNSMTVLDGYPMAKAGRAGVAIGAATAASLLSAMAGLLVLSFAAPFVADYAIRFGPPEFFLLAIGGLLLISIAVREDLLKGLVSACLGMLLSFIGFSPILGAPRFTFDVSALDSGISFISLAIGLFAISEAILLMERGGSISSSGRIEGGVREGMMAAVRHKRTLLRSIAIGLGLGALPGVGATTANLMSYLAEVRSSRHRDRYGKGEVKGVIAAEASNNAVVGTSLIPTLTLGIPGSATAAMLVGALIIHGVFPGPQLFAEEQELVYAFIASLFIAQIAWFVLGLSLTNVFARISTTPVYLLVPILLVVCLLAVYSERESMADVYAAILIGIAAYFMRRFGFSPVPLLIAFILTPLAEEGFHQSMLMSGDSLGIFVERTYSQVILAIVAAGCLLPLAGKLRKRPRSEVVEETPTGS